MLRGCRALALSIPFAVIACQPPQEDSPTVLPSAEAAVADVERIFEAYVGNWNAPDIEAVLAVLADDVVQMPPDTVIRGKEDLGAGWRQHLEENSDTWTPTITDIEPAGDLVFVRGTFAETWTPKAGGEMESISGQGIWVFRWHPSGTWKLVLEQWFNMEPGA